MVLARCESDCARVDRTRLQAPEDCTQAPVFRRQAPPKPTRRAQHDSPQARSGEARARRARGERQLPRNSQATEPVLLDGLLAERAGFESDQSASIDGASSVDRGLRDPARASTGVDGSLNGASLDRGLDRAVPSDSSLDRVESALAKAIEEASAAGRFDVVALLAGELQARRLARDGVALLRAARPRGTR